MQLSKRSKPIKVHWTSLPPNEEKIESQKCTDMMIIDSSTKDEVLNSNNLISLKERINQLKINSPEHIVSIKPKIMPKPIVSIVSKPIENPSIIRIRGKLDKSYSTPSYDFSGDSNLHNEFEYFDSELRISVEDVKNWDTKKTVNKEKIKRPDKPVLVFPKPPSPRNDDISFAILAETSNTNFVQKSTKPILYFPKPPPTKTEDIDLTKLKNTNIVDNVELESQSNRSINQLNSKVSEFGNEFHSTHEKHLLSSINNIIVHQHENFLDYNNGTHLSQDKVPISINSLKYSTNRSNNKSSENKKHQDSIDFEKTSLSDLSDACLPLSLTDLSGSDDNIFQVDTKDNISLPSERSAIILHQAVLNAPATFPRHKTEVKKSQPPIPPPRPSKPVEIPKRTSYRAMLGAKTIGKKEIKGQKQLFQKNPLLASKFVF